MLKSNDLTGEQRRMLGQSSINSQKRSPKKAIWGRRAPDSPLSAGNGVLQVSFAEEGHILPRPHLQCAPPAAPKQAA
jgi:hypothetical protein